MVVYKTASQSGTHDIFETFKQYIEHCKSTPEGHRIIETSRVPELKGQEVVISIDGWGNKKVVVNGQEFTITQFFSKYRY